MCQRVLCEKCHKPTHKGCGKHIEQVLKGVLPADRCQCGAREQFSHLVVSTELRLPLGSDF